MTTKLYPGCADCRVHWQQRERDPEDMAGLGKLPPVGGGFSTGIQSSIGSEFSLGDVQLSTVWQDPDIDGSKQAYTSLICYIP